VSWWWPAAPSFAQMALPRHLSNCWACRKTRGVGLHVLPREIQIIRPKWHRPPNPVRSGAARSLGKGAPGPKLSMMAPGRRSKLVYLVLLDGRAVRSSSPAFQCRSSAQDWPGRLASPIGNNWLALPGARPGLPPQALGRQWRPHRQRAVHLGGILAEKAPRRGGRCPPYVSTMIFCGRSARIAWGPLPRTCRSG